MRSLQAVVSKYKAGRAGVAWELTVELPPQAVHALTYLYPRGEKTGGNLRPKPRPNLRLRPKRTESERSQDQNPVKHLPRQLGPRPSSPAKRAPRRVAPPPPRRLLDKLGGLDEALRVAAGVPLPPPQLPKLPPPLSSHYGQTHGRPLYWDRPSLTKLRKTNNSW